MSALPLKNFFSYFFEFFLFLSLPSVVTRQSFCRVLDKKHSVKTPLPISFFAVCSCRVFLGHWRVPETLGKASVSSSGEPSPEEGRY